MLWTGADQTAAAALAASAAVGPGEEKKGGGAKKKGERAKKGGDRVAYIALATRASLAAFLAHVGS